MTAKRVNLRTVLNALEEIAPLELAEEWDNVGLLVEPIRSRRISRILLTIDLTESVLDEALGWGAECIVAYHPPLFDPLRRVSSEVPIHRVLSSAIHARVAIYSPHTALDSVDGGVNDWLAAGLGEGTVERADSDAGTPGAPASLARVLTLKRPISLKLLATRVKQHLSLSYVRLARAQHPEAPSRIRRVAVCAGAGASALEGIDADAYVTGEMRHHDALDAVGRGRHVVLCEHTNTERGYLPLLKKALLKRLPGTAIRVSRADREPVQLG